MDLSREITDNSPFSISSKFDSSNEMCPIKSYELVDDPDIFTFSEVIEFRTSTNDFGPSGFKI